MPLKVALPGRVKRRGARSVCPSIRLTDPAAVPASVANGVTETLNVSGSSA